MLTFKDINLIKPKGLTKNVLSLLIIFGTLPLIILFLLFFIIYFNVQKSNIEKIQKESVKRISENFTNYIEKNINQIDALSKIMQISNKDELFLKNISLDILEQNNEFDEVTIVDTTGLEKAKISRYHTYIKTEFENLKDDKNFQEALNGQLNYTEIKISDYNNFPYIYIYSPIMPLGSDKASGVLIVGLNVSKMWNFISKYHTNDDNYAYVVDKNGILIIHKEMSLVLKKTDLSYIDIVKKSINKINGVFEYKGLNGKKVVGSSSTIPYTEWTVILELSAFQAFKNIYIFSIIFFTLLTVTLFFVILLGFQFSLRKIVNPIKYLKEETQIISTGDFSRSIILNQDDEIGDLGKSFNAMVKNLNDIKEKLVKAEEKYRNIFENSSVGIYQTTKDGKFIIANQACANILGYESTNELLNAPINIGKDIYTNPEERKKVLSLLQEYKSLRNYETKFYKKDKSIIDISINAHLIEVNNNDFIIEGIIEDITKRKLAEEILHRDKKELENLVHNRTIELEKINNKLQEEIKEKTKIADDLNKAKEMLEVANKIKDEFIANVSHEIRTPLNSILGFTDILIKEIYYEKHLQYLYAISLSGKTLLNIINEILDLSKIDAGKLELEYKPTNIYPIISEIQNIFSYKIEDKGLNFEVNIDPFLPTYLLIDELRLKQILFNLVDNAIKFTDSGGITITVNKLYKNDKHDILDLMISVKDTGIGISPENREIIFEAYHQQKGQNAKKYGGTGLGLSICKKLIELMNGEIYVESKIGEGSDFNILLKDVKVYTSTENIEKIEADDFDNIQFDKASILIADDIIYNRIIIKKFLENFDFEIIEAKTGKEIFDIINQKDINLIIMDIKLSDMSGEEVMAKIKDNPKFINIPIIAISAVNIKKNDKIMVNKLCDEFLQKPIIRKDLISLLKNFIPHTVKTTKNKVTLNEYYDLEFIDNYQISKEMIDNNKELIKTLKTEFISYWESVSETYIVNDIIEFSNELITLGKKYNFKLILKYADDLFTYCKNFDIENIEKALKFFPIFVKKIIELLDKEG